MTDPPLGRKGWVTDVTGSGPMSLGSGSSCRHWVTG